MKLFILTLALAFLGSSCFTKKHASYYYKSCGKLFCNFARLEEEKVRAMELDSIPEQSYFDSLNRMSTDAYNRYKEFTASDSKYRLKSEKFTTEQERLTYFLEGYGLCNCDTCIYSVKNEIERRKLIKI